MAIKKLSSGYNPLNIKLKSYVTEKVQVAGVVPLKKAVGQIHVLGLQDFNKLKAIVRDSQLSWQLDIEKKFEREVIHFSGNKGPVWIFHRRQRPEVVSHQGSLEESNYSWYRDQAGSLLGFFKAYGLELVQLDFHGTDAESELGFLVGLDLAAYNFKAATEGTLLLDLPKIILRKTGGSFAKSILRQAAILAEAINWSRHLVNTPPNFLHPKSLSQWAQWHFKKTSTLKLEVWDEKRLTREGMGLHLGVGQGGSSPPCLIHLRYRPPGSKNRPVAIVGKGITFDSGGLDIKPSAGMRLMKKDMGGAASVFGLAHWAAQSKYPEPLDFYAAIAENSIDAKSMRPSDVLIARNGIKVEIHNTDAEGRLVLADALDVAVTQKGKDEPEIVINLATLTGAIKVALGSEIAGLFSNHDSLAEELNLAGQKAGDLNWRMPLYARYSATFSSSFADMVNAVDGFGGAITAALFLEKFVKGKPWAHLDIYGWNDKAQGARTFAGGNGQGVQCLRQYLEARTTRR